MATKISDTVLTPQAVQNNPDLLLRRILFAMCKILMHRYDKRRENTTPSLFDNGNDPEPTVPLKADVDGRFAGQAGN